jgi:hypothetical protein
MFSRSPSTPATEAAVPMAGPNDTCIRCGRPTPLGVALCEQDNPAHIKGPSATQVHGTIVLGLIGGFVLLALLLRFATVGVGPFGAAVTGIATRPDGGLEVVVRVTNDGSRESAASCRVSSTGAPNPTDLVFFTQLIPAGESRDITSLVPPPAAGGPALPPSGVTVRCN